MKEIEKKLETGLSGCKLELIDSNILRKHSSSQSYNKRLELQVKKQELFSSQVFRNVETPKVLSKSDSYFDMEYVSGRSFDEYFSVCSLNDIDFVLNSLFEYFDGLILNARYYNSEVSKKRLLEKIDSLMSGTQYLGDLYHVRQIVRTISMKIPQTFCHGDLTFTNVIFNKNRLYFIDFLDCYIDSFLSDLIKLKQDLYYHWSLDVQGIKNLRIRQIYSLLWRKLEKRYSQYVETIEFDCLDILNTLRLEPYLTNENQRIIIKRMLKCSSLYGNSHCPDGGAV